MVSGIIIHYWLFLVNQHEQNTMGLITYRNKLEQEQVLDNAALCQDGRLTEDRAKFNC